MSWKLLFLREATKSGVFITLLNLKKVIGLPKVINFMKKQVSIILKLQCYHGSHEGMHSHSTCWKGGAVDPWTTWSLEVSAPRAAENPWIAFGFPKLMTPSLQLPWSLVYLWLHWSSRLLELSLIALSRGYSSCRGFSVAEPGPQDSWASGVVATGLAALQPVESFWTGDQTWVPSTGRWFLPTVPAGRSWKPDT